MKKENALGRPPLPRVMIDKERFFDVLKYRGWSIRSLGRSYDFKYSDNTIQKQLSNTDGVTIEFLDYVAEFLDVDPNFIKGRYNIMHPSLTDDQRKAILLKRLYEGKFPYQDTIKVETAKAEVGYREYYKAIIPAHGIPFNSFESMSFKERLALQRDIEIALGKVFQEYFGGDDIERYEYLTWWDFDQIEEIYDWFGLDELMEPAFFEKLKGFWAELDEYEKNMEIPTPDDDEMVEETILDCATGEKTTRMVRYGDLGKDLKRKYGIIPEDE